MTHLFPLCSFSCPERLRKIAFMFFIAVFGISFPARAQNPQTRSYREAQTDASGNTGTERTYFPVAGNHDSGSIQQNKVATGSVVLTTDEYQSMEGFGISGAFMANHFYSTYSSSVRQDVLTKLFSTSQGAGISILRSKIETTNNGIDEFQMHLITDAKTLGVNKFISESWSPPTSMTLLQGGERDFNPASADTFARYITNYVAGMKSNAGITISSVGVQNEPAIYNSAYESCLWTNQGINSFIPILRTKLDQAGFSNVTVHAPDDYAWDVSLQRTQFLISQNTDKYLSAFTTHGYGSGSDGDRVSLSSSSSQKHKSLWMTEWSDLNVIANPDGSETEAESGIDNGLTWATYIWDDIANSANVSAWFFWWIYSPNNPSNPGLISHDLNNNISYPKRYYTFSQFSRFIRPGAQRIGVQTNSVNAQIAAFKSIADQEIIIVVINSAGAEQDMAFDLSQYNVDGTVQTYRTSASESMTQLPDDTIHNQQYSYAASPQSVTTLVIPTLLSNPQYTVTCSASPPCAGTVSGGGSVGHMASVTLTATPNSNWVFDHWSAGGTAVTDSRSYSFLVAGDTTFVANFSPVAGPPAKPTLSSPNSGSINQPRRLLLSWDSFCGATSYHLQVSQNSNFSSTIYDRNNITSASQQVGGLAAGTMYYWHVSVINDSGTGAYSSPWSFTTYNGPPPVPDAFNLLSPSNASLGQTVNGTLSWEVSSDAVGYDVYLDGNNSPSTIVSNNQSGTSYSYGGLLNGSTYYWKVIAKNITGDTTAMGAPWSFSTASIVKTNRRWNLISLPMDLVNRYYKSAYPTSISTAFRYEGTYVPSDTLKIGLGYWLKFPAAESLSFVGAPTLTESIAVHPGWNLIGSISRSIPTSSITSDPPGIVTSSFFGYAQSYIVTDSIESGKGYWVKANQEGFLILSSSSQVNSKNHIRIIPTKELPPPPPDYVSSQQVQIPKEYALEQSFPNPFNPSTMIKYQLPVDSRVSLKIYNVLGQVVSTLLDDLQAAGYRSIDWNATNYSSGIYFYRLEATSITNPSKSFTRVKKMLLLK